MTKFPQARRTARLACAALLAALSASFWQVGTAGAQEGLPRVVMISKIRVAPENHDAFRAWIAEFRTLVEGMIAQNRLSPVDTCAYESWRVLGPDPAGLNEDFLFVFEPVIPLGNYLLQHYVNLALEGEAASEMMRRWIALAELDADIIYASPLDPDVDAVDLGAVCDF